MVIGAPPQALLLSLPEAIAPCLPTRLGHLKLSLKREGPLAPWQWRGAWPPPRPEELPEPSPLDLAFLGRLEPPPSPEAFLADWGGLRTASPGGGMGRAHLPAHPPAPFPGARLANRPPQAGWEAVGGGAGRRSGDGPRGGAGGGGGGPVAVGLGLDPKGALPPAMRPKRPRSAWSASGFRKEGKANPANPAIPAKAVLEGIFPCGVSCGF